MKKTWLFFIQFCVMSYRLSNSKCLNVEDQTQLCDFCSYDYFTPVNHLLKNISSSMNFRIPSDECILKNTTFLMRSILIVNTENFTFYNSSLFDEIYNDIFLALVTENLVLSQYSFSEISFLFSKGFHYVIAPNNRKKDDYYSFFQRLNTSIIFKPYLCPNDSNQICCSSFERPTIFIKSAIFFFFIANYFEINGIVFDFIESLYPFSENSTNVCLQSKESICCSENSITNINSSDPCNLYSKSYAHLYDKLELHAFFIMESIVDSPYLNYGQLIIKNTDFRNLYLTENSNQFIDTLIIIRSSNVHILIDNVLITNIFILRSILYFDHYPEISCCGNFTLNSLSIKNFNPLHIQINNVETFDFFDFYLFDCFLTIIHLHFDNFSSVSSFNSSLMSFQKMSKCLLIEIEIFDLEGFSLFSFVSSEISLKNVYIENYNWNDKAIQISNNSLISFESLLYTKSSSKYLLSIFLNIDDSQLIILNSTFSYLNVLQIKVLNGGLEIKGSNLYVISSTSFLITSSSFKSHNVLWNMISGQTLFFYQSLLWVEIISNQFYNCSFSTLINSNNVNLILINNTNFLSLSKIKYFFGSGSTIDNLHVINSRFFDLNITIYFLLLVSQGQGTILLSNSSFELILFNNTKSNVFIQAQTANFMISFSKFSKIQFASGGNQIISIKTGNINVTNSIFLDNGWLYFVDIRTRSALEFIVLLYIWSAVDVFIINSTFINQGPISLFSGFVISTLHQGSFFIDNCSFIAKNKSLGLNYHGVILIDSPLVYIANNYFEGLECSEFNSIEHMNGVLSLQGESSYIRKGNNKVAFLFNNSFFDCKCKNGGSIGLLNFLNITVKNLKLENTQAKSKGGALEIISCPKVYIANGVVVNSSGSSGGAFYISNVKLIVIISSYFCNVNSLEGGIFAIQIGTFYSYDLNLYRGFALKNAAAFLFIDSNVNLDHINFYNQSALENGGVIALKENDQFLLSNSTSILSSASNGGFFYCFKSIQMEIAKSFIANSFANNTGGCFDFDSMINLVLDNLIFQKNLCRGFGILFFSTMDIDSVFIFKNLEFSENAANSGSCVYSQSFSLFFIQNTSIFKAYSLPLFFQWNYQIIVDINNMTISNSFSFDSFLSISNVNLTLKNVKFENNKCQNYLMFIEESLVDIELLIIKADNLKIFNVLFSDIKVRNVELEDETHQAKTNLFNVISSSLFLIDSNFEDHINFQNSFIVLRLSQLNLQNCSFKNISGPILLLYDCNMSMFNCFFLYNHHGEENDVENIDFQNSVSKIKSNFFLTNSTFLCGNGSSVNLKSANIIIIEYSTFQGSMSGIGITVEEFFYISIRSLFFSKFKGDRGAAIFINDVDTLDESTSKVFEQNISIIASVFDSNQANLGGALYFNVKCMTFITNTTFYGNYADGISGAVKYINPNPFLLIIDSCKFINNMANFDFPNIFSTSPILSMNNFFLNNTGKSKNSSFGSFPLRFLSNSSLNSTIKFRSGIEFPLIFQIIDFFNHSFSPKMTFTGYLFFESGPKSDKMQLINTLSLPSNSDEIKFPRLLIRYKPDTYFYMKIVIKIYDFEVINQYEFNQTFQFYSRPCIQGEILTSFDTCFICPLHSYSLENPMLIENNKTFCKRCDPNANCPGGSIIIPKSGYWRFSENSSIIRECPLSSTCLGGPDFFTDLNSINMSWILQSQCQEGHYGNLCYDCEPGYGKFDNLSVCKKCNSYSTVNNLRFFLLLVLILFYIYFNAKPLYFDDAKVYNILLKIVINHLQKISVVSSSGVIKFLIVDVQGYFNFLNQISVLSEESFSNDCFIQSIIVFGPNLFFQKTFLIFLIPFLISGGSIFIYVLLNYDSKQSLRQLKHKFSLILFITIFLFYPLITRCSLKFFNCFDLTEQNAAFLYASPNTQCWQGQHLLFFGLFGILGLIFWGIGFPIYLLIYLRHMIKAQSIYELSNKSNKKKLKESLTSGYGFFVKTYHIHYYFWESVIFIQKFGLIFVQNIPNILNQEIQDFLYLSILLIYFLFLQSCCPFSLKKMNSLESFSIITVILTKVLLIFAGIVIDHEIRIVFIYVLSIAIFLINIAFFLAAIRYLITMTDWRKLKKDVSKYVFNCKILIPFKISQVASKVKNTFSIQKEKVYF